MKRPSNLNMVPAGGWSVTFPTGFTATSNHPASFLHICAQHMMANEMPEPWVYKGGWAEEIWNQVCLQHPEIPFEDDEQLPERKLTGADVRRFVASIVEAKSQGAEAVSDEEQDRRLEICSRCPKRTIISCNGWCGWLAETLNSFSIGRKSRRIPEFHKQHCGVCGCDLSLVSQWPLDVLQAVDAKLGVKEEYWPECWKLEKPSQS